MEETLQLIKDQRAVKTFTWNIIVLSFLGFIFGLIGIAVFLKSQINLHSVPQDSLANFLNPRLYLFQSILQIIIGIILVMSSFYVLKLSEKWRKILIVGLIIEILFLLIIPVINTGHIPNVDTRLQEWGSAKTRIVLWSFIISYCIAGFYILSLIKFTRVRYLFK